MLQALIRTAWLSLLAALLSAPLLAQSPDAVATPPPNVPEFRAAFAGQTRAPEVLSGVDLKVEVVAAGLLHPWGLALLPDGAMLVSERAGRLRLIDAGGALIADPITGLPDVLSNKQGGLLDIAAAPDFAASGMVYWTYAKPVGAGLSATAAARGRLSADRRHLTEVMQIYEQSPASPSPAHFGSRIGFEAGGAVIITTGDHFTETERQFAQDLAKGHGKVVRLNPDGSVPDDNPYAGHAEVDSRIARVFTYGHRNVQGLHIDQATGAVWIVEHGPQGGDELNLLKPGANYGWPVISYGENYDGTPVGAGITAAAGMEQPVYYWDPVIAPGDIVAYQGAMFPDWYGDFLIASLNPGGIVRLEMRNGLVTGEERMLTDQGRIRDVDVAADGAILVLTDQDDGAVLRLTPAR